MLGQIKVMHSCRQDMARQCVYLQDLEKHIEMKCQGFEIECFCCTQKIKTFKNIQKHLKYDCPKLKINCQFCGNWHSRENFKDPRVHPCQEEFETILDKFQGNINKLIEEDTSEQDSVAGEEEKVSEAQY